MSQFKVIGQDTLLMDGTGKLTGQLRYAADLKMPGMLHARLLTSPYPHARISGIDTADALTLPGVVAVITARDLPEMAPSNRAILLLAREKVIFIGQPVALVIAETEAAAEDGLAQVRVDYDPLPAVVTMDDALNEAMPVLWENGIPGENPAVVSNSRMREPETQGDIAAGFAAADRIIERTFETSWVHQSSLETHGMLVQPDMANGGATVWSATQDPFGVRLLVAEALDVPETTVRVIATPLGGGFGGKFPLYEALVALAARIVNQPVRLILTRSEELLATNPAPAMRIRMKLGAKQDGTLVALDSDILIDDGCYPGAIMGYAVPILTTQYNIENFRISAGCVMTNKSSSGAYRGPGAPCLVMALDSMIDDMAVQLHRDPLEVKQQNMLARRPGTPHGGKEVMAAIADHPLWQNRDALRAQGRGVGVALVVWYVGVQSGAASCSLNRDGRLIVNVGTADVSGSTTSMAMMAAEVFGVDANDVRVVVSDTTSSPLAGGSGGSMITYNTGSAVIRAAEDAKRQVLEIAAQEFEAAVEDIEIVNGGVQVRGVPDKAISLKTIASKSFGFGSMYAPVYGNGRWAETNGEFVYCGQMAEVEVDRETGEVRVLRLVIVQDAGRAINPAAVRGQMAGGATQGIGWALYEQMRYDDSGQLLSGSWMDYAMPHASQTAPDIETIIVEVPSEWGPLGVRGVGEPPVVPTAAAVANAIAHATGARLAELPMTPVRVLEALHKQQ